MDGGGEGGTKLDPNVVPCDAVVKKRCAALLYITLFDACCQRQGGGGEGGVGPRALPGLYDPLLGHPHLLLLPR